MSYSQGLSIVIMWTGDIVLTLVEAFMGIDYRHLSLSCQNSRVATCLRGQSKWVLGETFAKPRLVSACPAADCRTSSDHIPVFFDIPARKHVTHREHSLVNMNSYGNIMGSALPSMPTQENNARAKELVSITQN